MATLKYPATAPPGGFIYLQAETKLRLDGDSLHALIAKVISHRRYKGLKPDDEPTVRLEVQRQICTRLGRNDCTAEEMDSWVPQPNNPRFTLSDILAFSRTMLELIKSGKGLVNIHEAERRRAICVGCPLNQRATGCKCGILYKMIDAMIPRERRFADLHICGVCHCSNAAKVNVPLAAIRADGRKLDFPVHCWQHPSHDKDLPPAR